MSEVRYLGMVVGGASTTDARPNDPRLGRFVSMAEPLPVGTSLELDGAPHRVTRVEEGATSGAWLWPDGAARTAIDDGPTLPERVISIEAEPTSGMSAVGLRAIPFDEPPERPAPGAPDENAAPEAVADAASAPTGDEPGPGGKKRKRRSKTVMGR